MKRKILLITGASSGFGRAISEAAIAAGHTVIGTVRRDAAASNYPLEKNFDKVQLVLCC